MRSETRSPSRRTSSIFLCLVVALAARGVLAATVTRGPYLQLGTTQSVTIRWRTDVPTDSVVRFGPAPGQITSLASDPSPTTDHVVTVHGLTPQTRYYYAIGSISGLLAGGDPQHTFLTSPPAGEAVPVRIWALGDAGTGSDGARAVRDAYYRTAGTAATNVWLMLGDNGYENGADADYQKGIFDTYRDLLATTVLWPTLGNHDTNQQTDPAADIAYFQDFTLPAAGEGGGVPSGTERYYAFDYGNIHFISLDSIASSRDPAGPMLTWLQQDLAVNRLPWVIAFWHYPPYSKGSHDSDVESALGEMRRNALPILENAGVDLVLCGHSHSYERSYLLDGHYGKSTTFLSSMKVDGGDGRSEGNGAYRKPSLSGGAHEGAVYVVAGSGGMTGGGPLNHPAMFESLNQLGSLVIEVNGERLDATFLRSDGSAGDRFTIIKGSAKRRRSAR